MFLFLIFSFIRQHFSFFFLLLFLMVCISVGEQVVVVTMARENAGAPGAGVIQGRELPDMRAKTQTPILCKVNRCF